MSVLLLSLVVLVHAILLYSQNTLFFYFPFKFYQVICIDWNRNYFYLQLVSEDNVVWKSLKSNLKKYIFQMALLYCTCPNPTSHIISKVELFNSLLIAIAVSVLRAILEVHCQDWNRSLTLYLPVKLSLYIYN